MIALKDLPHRLRSRFPLDVCLGFPNLYWLQPWKDTGFESMNALLVVTVRRAVRSARAFWKSEDGLGMVEFALVGALFVLILFGIVEFGLAVWQKNSVAADAREGARYAIVRGGTMTGHVATTDSVRNFVRSRTSLDATGVRVYTTWTPDNTPGSKVSVSVAHSVPRRGPIIRAHIDSATSQMTIF